MGGDADLVLEAVAIDLGITHNVFMILPANNELSYVVSLWETTRMLGRYLLPRGSGEEAEEVERDGRRRERRR